MSTSRPFSYYNGYTPLNTDKYGNILVGLTGVSLTDGGLSWFNGPDEDLGYVIAHDGGTNRTYGNNFGPIVGTSVGFWRSSGKTDNSFLNIASNTGQTFSSASNAKTWLESNGYWTSYLSVFLTGVFIDSLNTTLLIESNGSGWAWGLNNGGSLGANITFGTAQAKCTPVAIYGGHTFTRISIFNQGVALDQNGQAWSWGLNQLGVLGDNTITDRLTPVAVCGGHTFTEISAGGATIALDTTGKAWTWGANTEGQLGDNTRQASSGKSTPVAVCGGLTFTKVSISSGAMFAITNTGVLYSWGSNSDGQLGVNLSSIASNNRSNPVPVCGGQIFTQLAKSSSSRMFAINTSGILYGWGRNLNSGNIGDNTTINRLSPVAVCGGKIFTAVSAGDTTIALDNTGKAWAWGSNGSGSIGDGTIISKLTPVAVCGGLTFTKVSAGISTHGVDTTGQVWSWGRNLYGNLGNNTTGDITNRSTPVAVCPRV